MDHDDLLFVLRLIAALAGIGRSLANRRTRQR